VSTLIREGQLSRGPCQKHLVVGFTAADRHGMMLGLNSIALHDS
jgi:hypothetical protein